jgi:hypothetical protein
MFVESVPALNEKNGAYESMPEYPTQSQTEPMNIPDTSDSDEGINIRDLTDEDAESLVGVSISLAASRMTSARTPAAEKAAIMDNIDGGGLFDSEEDATSIPGTPQPIRNDPVSSTELSEKLSVQQSSDLPSADSSAPLADVAQFPTPWLAGQKAMAIQRPEASRTALRNALDPAKRRSFSGSGEALRKLFPSMPSMPKAGLFMQNLPSPPFFSSSSQKSRNRGSTLPTKATASSVGNMYASNETTPIRGNSPTRATADDGKPHESISTVPGAALYDDQYEGRPKLIRRATSDDSLLYHSLSRASSLGDDSRWEDQHEMVNSRVKAIKDSLQDRSSFRLPSMPSMPSIPRIPSFDLGMNFGPFSGNGLIPGNKLRNDTNTKQDLATLNIRKKSAAIADSTVAPNTVPSTVSMRTARTESFGDSTDFPNTKPLDRVIAGLTGDVVIMGGYRGSILRSAKPPHRQLWVPIKVGMNIRKVNMEVGLYPEDEERMEETIFASGMIQNIGPVDISRRLFKKLRESKNAKNGTLRVWDYGYDWRLSPHLLAKKLRTFLEGLPSNQPGSQTGALVIAHSLGGVITRHVVNQRPELFSGVLYAGVPQSCINILGPLRNGDDVLLSSRVLTAQVNFTLRTSFVLLPLDGYGFIDKTTKEPYLVDFFNVDDWVKYRFSPCTDPPLPAKAQTTGSLATLLKTGSLSNLQLPGRKNSNPISKKDSRPSSPHRPSAPKPFEFNRQPAPATHLTTRAANLANSLTNHDPTLAVHIGSSKDNARGHSNSVSTIVTMPREEAIAYLRRILPEIKRFKEELAHNPELEAENRYPPLAIMYGKSIPTVYGAKVDGRDGISCQDVYDNLAFASGDGVCLARDAMLPEGYQYVKGGRIKSDRGHVTLLGDLNAVGMALEALQRGRRKGIGLGPGNGRIKFACGPRDNGKEKERQDVSD